MTARTLESTRKPGGCTRAWSAIRGAAAIFGVALSLFLADPARATHEPINIDGDLTDLAEAIGRNPGASNGGFAMEFPDNELMNEVHTQDCAFVNGFDVRNYYFFLDVGQPGGATGPPVTLYGGWEVFGIIGDVDGDGSASGFNPVNAACAESEQNGIGSRESYTVLFDFDCDFVHEFEFVVSDNRVELRVPGAGVGGLELAVDLTAQSSFAMVGSSLEMRVDNVEQIIADLVRDGHLPEGSDLCNARIRMTANAEEDGLGEDRSQFQNLELPPSVAVTKTPSSQDICPGAQVTWTITVSNDGLCELSTVNVSDVLDAGMTYVSSSPARASGDDQNSVWNFTDMAPGDSQTITLIALVAASCSGQLANNVDVDAVHQPPFACGTQPRGAFATTDAFVNCASPVCSITITAPGSADLCVGGSAELCGPDGAFTYAWTGPDNFTATTRCISITNATSTDAGTYSLVVTDIASGCSSDPCTQVITVNDPPVCSITGEPTGSVGLGGSFELCGPDGDYSYAWSLPNATSATTQCVTVTSAVESDFGTYTLIVTDNQTGCSSTSCSVTIPICEPPDCTITADPAGPVCQGTNIELCGPEGTGYTYAWTLPDGSSATSRCITITSAQAANSGDIYRLTVTNPDGVCSSDCTYTLDVNPPPPCSITIGGSGLAELCVGENTELCGPEGDYSWAWTGPNNFTATTRCISITSATSSDAGSYSLVVTDNQTGCSSDPCSQPITVTDPPLCSIAGEPTGAVQIGDSVELCGPEGTGFTYAWTLPGGGTSTLRCITIASVQTGDIGTYTLIVTNADGCSSTPCSAEIMVCDPPPCDITGPETLCTGQALTLCGPVGDYTYDWTLPDGTVLTSATECVTIPVPDPGIYTLKVSDGEGCFSTCTHRFKVNKRPPCAIAGQDSVCAGQATQLCGPVGNYAWAWTLPDGSPASTQCLDLDDPASGIYSLVVTDLDTGCDSDPCTFDLHVRKRPICAIAGPDPLCAGENTQLCGPEGDFSYAWTRPNGATASTRCLDFSNVSAADAGEYWLVVTNNATGCESDPCSFELVVRDAPICSITADPPGEDPFNPNLSRLCIGDNLTLCGPEGANYTYLWTLPGGATQTTRCITITDAQVGDAGTYRLMLSDATSGCEGSDPCTYEVRVTPPPPCNITPDPTGPIVVGNPVTMCGPPGPFTYKWTFPGGAMETTRCITINSVEPSDAGTYRLKVTDPGGCMTECSYELTVDDLVCNLELLKTAKPDVVVPQPQPDCETIGKPRTLTFRYTGEGCNATSHNQDPSKVSCDDFGALGNGVEIVYTGSDSDEFSVTPSGPINIGDEVTVSAVGRDRFHSESEFEIRRNGQVLQYLRFHTSCSQPLALGDQFGSLELIGMNGVVGSGNEVTYTYVVKNHGSTVVNATLSDDKLGVIASNFDLAAGETKMYTRTSSISVTTTNVATVTGNLGDAGGPVCEATDEATVRVEPPPVSCDDGKPRSLVFQYTGDNCNATTNTQEDKAKCDDLGVLGEPVEIVYVGKDPQKFAVIPSGEVINLGDSFTIAATGRDRFHSNTKLEIRQGGKVLQKLEIHTSCSKPLNVGDQFGSLLLTEFHLTLITAATPAGNDVTIDLAGDAMVSFQQVTDNGSTYLFYGAAGAQLPEGLVALNDEAMHITSAATFQGTVGLAVRYDPSTLTVPESEIRLMHLSNGVWQEITTAVDEGANQVMGISSGLSTYVIAAPVTALSAPNPVVNDMAFAIRSSYPNPTRGSATIRYTLSKGGPVSLTVHDIQGRQVASLESGFRGAGEHQALWSGRAMDGRKLAAGIYVIRLEAAEGLRTSKLVLMD